MKFFALAGNGMTRTLRRRRPTGGNAAGESQTGLGHTQTQLLAFAMSAELFGDHGLHDVGDGTGGQTGGVGVLFVLFSFFSVL